MFYIVKSGDTLYSIAIRFKTTIQALLNANVICNPGLIYPGQVLVIPKPGIEIQKAGGTPYYIVVLGDTLYCLARQFNTTMQNLARANSISNPNVIYPDTELLIAYDIPDPEQLKSLWENTALLYCDSLNSLQVYGIYYIGTFQWEAIGKTALPYLNTLATNPCDVVRYYTITALGRIASEDSRQILLNSLKDHDPITVKLAELALHKLDIIKKNKRIHVTTSDAQLFEVPRLDSPYIPLPQGTDLTVERWYIPSPAGEDFPPAGLAVWDYVKLTDTNKMGFLLRVGYNQILIM